MKKKGFIRYLIRIYDRVNDYLEAKLDRFLDFADRHRYPLIVTFSLHLALVILIVNLTFSYLDISEPKITAVSMEEIERIEREWEDERGFSGRTQAEDRLNAAQGGRGNFTNRASSGSDLGEDIDISRVRTDFSTLQEARNVTQQSNQYGQEVRVDLFSEQAKNRSIDLDDYQKIDSSAFESAVQAPYAGKSTIYYGFDGNLSRQNIAPIPVPIYTVQLGGLVVVDIKVNRSGKVVFAQVNRQKTTCPNEDAYQKAETYARRARFNVDPSAPEAQSGYISYEFQ